MAVASQRAQKQRLLGLKVHPTAFRGSKQVVTDLPRFKWGEDRLHLRWEELQVCTGRGMDEAIFRDPNSGLPDPEPKQVPFPTLQETCLEPMEDYLRHCH